MLPSSFEPFNGFLAQLPTLQLHLGLWQVVGSAIICVLEHVQPAASASAPTGVPYGCWYLCLVLTMIVRWPAVGTC